MAHLVKSDTNENFVIFKRLSSLGSGADADIQLTNF